VDVRTSAPINTDLPPVETSTANIQSLDTAPTDNFTTYREGLIGRVQRLNPVFAALNLIDADITSLIFEGLTRTDSYGQIVPYLAENWAVSSDGLEYVFTLRQDVLWQDGIPFSADDVMYTVSILADPSYPGAEEVGRFWRTVETQKISDHMVRFRLAQPLSSFPDALRIGILPHHALVGTNALQLASHPINFQPIGTGPYQLEALRGANGQIQQVDLRVAPNYRKRPEGQTGFALERISFRLYDNFDDLNTALQQGEIEGYATQNPYMRALLSPLGSQYSAITGYEPSVGFAVFNWVRESQPAFRQETVRRALMMGADIKNIVTRDMINFAVPATSPLQPLSWAFDSSVALPDYDPTLASNLLSLAVIEPQSDVLLKFSILVPENPVLPTVAQEMAEQWSRLIVETNGVSRRVEVNVEVADPDTYRQRIESGDFDIAIIEYSKAPVADPDVYAFWHQGQYPDGLNYGGVNDRRTSEALERARRDPNGTNRAIYYKTFQQAFIERAAAIPLYYPLMTYYVDPRISGIQLGFLSNRADRFRNIQDWFFAG
jgi:peptide/nickel transport system substrate-binding protein